MNTNPMTLEQIVLVLNQNPMIKSIVYTLIQNPIVMNQTINILNVLNYNSNKMNQLKNMMAQEMLINNQFYLNMMNMMKNSPKNIIQLKNPDINIIFRHQNDPQISVKCSPDDKISSIIDKYNNKTGKDTKNAIFLSDGKKINKELTVGEQGLKDQSTILVMIQEITNNSSNFKLIRRGSGLSDKKFQIIVSLAKQVLKKGFTPVSAIITNLLRNQLEGEYWVVICIPIDKPADFNITSVYGNEYLHFHYDNKQFVAIRYNC